MLPPRATCSPMPTKRTSAASVSAPREDARHGPAAGADLGAGHHRARLRRRGRQAGAAGRMGGRPGCREETAFWDALATEAWDEPD